MNPVSATALYVSASRAVLQCDPKQPNTFTDMYNILPFFRQTLACLVCGKCYNANPGYARCNCKALFCQTKLHGNAN